MNERSSARDRIYTCEYSHFHTTLWDGWFHGKSHCIPLVAYCTISTTSSVTGHDGWWIEHMRQIVTVTGCRELLKKQDCHKKFRLPAVLVMNFSILNPNFFLSRPILPCEPMNLCVHGVTRHTPWTSGRNGTVVIWCPWLVVATTVTLVTAQPPIAGRGRLKWIYTLVTWILAGIHSIIWVPPNWVHARNYLDYTRLQLSIANSNASILLFMFLSADCASGL